MILPFFLIVALFVVLAFFLYLIMVFNGVIGAKNTIAKAESNIKVLLKQRFDEIPQLVEVCKGYMRHESETLLSIANLRSAFLSKFALPGEGTINDLESLDSELNGQMQSLNVITEKYPELKASKQFLYLQKRISEIENQIADRREYFNDSVNAYNTQLESVPERYLASVLGYKQRDFFTLKKSESEIPHAGTTAY